MANELREAHELSYTIAGPILRNIRHAYQYRDRYPLGTPGYIHYDKQIHQLFTLLDHRFRSTTPIFTEKIGQVHSSDEGEPFTWNQSTEGEIFDLATALKTAVPDSTNETDPKLKTPPKTRRASASEEKEIDYLMDMFNKGGKKKSKKLRRMRIL